MNKMKSGVMTMQKEKAFFLQVLADYMNTRTTHVPENISWTIMEEIGQAQQLAGIVYHQCKNSIMQSDLPDAEKNKWKLRYVYNSFLYSKRLALLKQINDEFQKENIPYLIFKGTEAAKFYPIPALRTMSDSDILVHAEDKQRTSKALSRIGFEMNTNLTNEWTGSKNELEIELHHRLIYDKTGEFKHLQAWGDMVWSYAVNKSNEVQYKLDVTYHLIYIMLHLRKHLLHTGAGFRQFMDVAALAMHPEINWQQAEIWLKELKLEKFANVCFAFCQRWFSINIPSTAVEMDEAFYEDATETIFTGGVFGLNNKDHEENRLFNEERLGESKGIFFVLNRAFLPYQKMRNIPYCQFLDGRPYLLPIAWCWRFIYVILNGRLTPFLKVVYGDETQNRNRFSNWGL